MPIIRPTLQKNEKLNPVIIAISTDSYIPSWRSEANSLPLPCTQALSTVLRGFHSLPSTSKLQPHHGCLRNFLLSDKRFLFYIETSALSILFYVFYNNPNTDCHEIGWCSLLRIFWNQIETVVSRLIFCIIFLNIVYFQTDLTMVSI